MKTYNGRRDQNGNCIVHVMGDEGNAHKLCKLLDLDKHSPTGFNWGYGGSGPAQLALAILADCLGDDGLAVRLHQPFKWAVIARLAQNADWHLDEDFVRQRVDELLWQREGRNLIAARQDEADKT
jgi:uncharacterized protein DUF6166